MWHHALYQGMSLLAPKRFKNIWALSLQIPFATSRFLSVGLSADINLFETQKLKLPQTPTISSGAKNLAANYANNRESEEFCNQVIY
jgi:hypothetical protein